MRWVAGIVGFILVFSGGMIFELAKTGESGGNAHPWGALLLLALPGAALWLGAFLWPRDH
jgi:hypothetical protein